MPIYLRQSTASQEVPLGPFVDDTNGKTAETALSIANTDVKVWASGATTLANKNSGGATHISGGIYYAVLDATDTATVGPLVLFVNMTGALAVRVECVVLHANVYDTLFGSTALSTYAGGAVASVTGNVGGNVVGSVGSVTGNVGGNVTGTVGSVVGNVGGNVVGSVASVTAAVTVGTNNDKTGYSLTVTPPTAAQTATAVRTELSTELGRIDVAVSTRLATAGYTAPVDVSSDVAAIKAKTDALPASPAATSDIPTAAQIADTTLRRTMAHVEASADGDAISLNSLYGSVQQMQKASVSGATLTVQKTDGSTLGTKTLTSDPDAEPITGVA